MAIRLVSSFRVVARRVYVAAQRRSAFGRRGGIGSFFVPLIFIFIIMYFVMIRPQKKAATATKFDREFENR